jgi:hypothetical protein
MPERFFVHWKRMVLLMKRDPLLQNIAIMVGIAAAYFAAGKLGLEPGICKREHLRRLGADGIALALSSCWAAEP